MAARTRRPNRPAIGHESRKGATVKPIYLDYLATTPLDPFVVEAMEPFLREHFGNPSSAHAYGNTAHDALIHARAQVAGLIGALGPRRSSSLAALAKRPTKP